LIHFYKSIFFRRMRIKAEYCWLCSCVSTTPCPECKGIYCSLHIARHRFQGTCLPLRLRLDDEKGKCLVATQDMKPLEVILREDYILITPYTKSKPICLGCYRKVKLQYSCESCGFPLCSKKCETSEDHLFECDLISKSKWRPQVDLNNETAPAYGIVMLLRCLSVRQKHPLLWNIFMSFFSHCEERRLENQELWDFHHKNAVQVLEQLNTHQDLSAEELHRILGIMYTNSVNMETGPEYGELTAFYPTFANINHSCTANTKTVKLADNTIEVRAQRPILRGEEITTQYVAADRPTRTRRMLLRKKWYFWCRCDRCKDPTEMGSLLGGLVCQNRTGSGRLCGGLVLPVNPLDENSVYACQDCGLEITGEMVDKSFKAAETFLRTPDRCRSVLNHMEHFLQEYSSVLYPSNYINNIVKLKLGQMYGNNLGCSFQNVPRPILERKLQVCMEVLEALSQVEPGFTKWRGPILAETNKTKLLLTDRDVKSGFVSPAMLVKAKLETRILTFYLSMYGAIYKG